mgnify:CR=1 FL=1
MKDDLSNVLYHICHLENILIASVIYPVTSLQVLQLLIHHSFDSYSNAKFEPFHFRHMREYFGRMTVKTSVFRYKKMCGKYNVP